MMRRMLTVVCTLALMFSLAACGSGTSDNTLATGTTGTTTTPAIPPAPEPTPTPPLQDGTGTGMSARELAFASEVFRLVNEYRMANGRGAILWSAPTAAVAQTHTLDMQLGNVLTHDGPAPCAAPADCLAARLMAGAVTFVAAGENVARGPQSAAAVMAAWRASPSHDANLLDPAWTHMGVGFVEVVDLDPTQTVAWWTQVFVTQP